MSVCQHNTRPLEVEVNDRMQQGYRYVRTHRMGEDFDFRFEPELTPIEMLELGVFCGKYLTDCRDEFPASWFERARLANGPRGRIDKGCRVGVEDKMCSWVEASDNLGVRIKLPPISVACQSKPT